MTKTTVAQVTVPGPNTATPYASTPWIAASAAVREIQTLSSAGTVSGGTFTLTYGTDETGNLDFDATAEEVANALNALSSVKLLGGVYVAGAIATDDMTITFKRSGNVTALVSDSTNITGGGTVDVAQTTAGVDGDQIALNGKQLLLVQNAHATDPFTFRLSSAADPYGRYNDVGPITLAAADILAFAKFPTVGWKQSDNYLYLDANSTNIQYMVIDMGSQPNA